ncbi:MAG: GIY-YIG nuclease family protein, partial [Bacilli bacterium]|nr:GIY-YIG nuclease family protein [Bacilli bacterium]
MKPKVSDKLKLLDESPGVYIMKDQNDEIIYVGKAKKLIKRVTQYFTRPQEGKTAKMVANVEDFDFIVTHSDKEAFLLEMNLIHKYLPRYNIRLKVGSSYPYIKIQ